MIYEACPLFQEVSTLVEVLLEQSLNFEGDGSRFWIIIDRPAQMPLKVVAVHYDSKVVGGLSLFWTKADPGIDDHPCEIWKETAEPGNIVEARQQFKDKLLEEMSVSGGREARVLQLCEIIGQGIDVLFDEEEDSLVRNLLQLSDQVLDYGHRRGGTRVALVRVSEKIDGLFFITRLSTLVQYLT